MATTACDQINRGLAITGERRRSSPDVCASVTCQRATWNRHRRTTNTSISEKQSSSGSLIDTSTSRMLLTPTPRGVRRHAAQPARLQARSRARNVSRFETVPRGVWGTPAADSAPVTQSRERQSRTRISPLQAWVQDIMRYSVWCC
jgi:hypothetical protein